MIYAVKMNGDSVELYNAQTGSYQRSVYSNAISATVQGNVVTVNKKRWPYRNLRCRYRLLSAESLIQENRGDIHRAWSGSNQTSDEFFYASYECDDGFKSSTSTIYNRFVRFAEDNSKLYYIRISGTLLCVVLTFNGKAVSSNSAESSKCGL
jgi:hypothetical protein